MGALRAAVKHLLRQVMLLDVREEGEAGPSVTLCVTLWGWVLCHPLGAVKQGKCTRVWVQQLRRPHVVPRCVHDIMFV